MTTALEEVVSLATLRAMVATAWRWPLELLEDIGASVRSLADWHDWLISFLGFGGSP